MSSLFGRSVRGFLSFALVAMMLASVATTPVSAAAQTSSIQSQLTGVTISYGPPYVLQEDASYVDDVLETLMFVGSADILAMGFMSPLIDLNGARDLMLETLFGELGTTATIDRGDYAGVSYSLDMLNFEGSEMGVFSLFMNQRSHGFAEFYIFIAPPALFGPTMQIAQDSFTINGSPLMDGVDSTVMGNMVTANVGITGGTAVTDVTDVTNTSETTDTTTTTTTDTSTTGSADGTAYLDTISSQRQQFLDSFQVFNDSLSVFGVNTSTDAEKQTAAQEMYAQAEYWAGFNDQAAQLSAPAGYENVHAAYLDWANEITNLGVLFIGLTNQEGPTFDDFDVQLEAVSAADDELVAQVNTARDSGAGSTDTTTGTDTGATRSTRGSDTGGSTTETTTTASADGSAYIDTLATQRAEFMDSFGVFTEALGVFGDDTATDQQKQDAFVTMTEQAAYWAGFNDTAAGISAPAGYEDVHQTYLTWSDEITTMGLLWVGFATQEGTTLDEFFAQVDVVNEIDIEFVAVLDEAASRDGGSTATTTGSSTESESQTTRSTRGTTAEDDEGTEADTSSRSTRSTRGTSESSSSETSTRSTRSTTTSGESTESGTGTTRSTRGSNTAQTENTSETQGQSGSTRSTSTNTGDNEWYMEVNDVTITWSDAFGLNENSDTPQVNDVESSEDKIQLQWNESDVVPVPMTITVFPNSGADSTGFVTGLSNDAGAVQGIFGEDAVVLDSVVDAEASAMLVQASDDRGEFFVYVQITCVNADCSTVAMLLIANEGLQVSDTVAAAEAGVAIDGIPVSGAMPASMVENLIIEFGS